MTNQLLFKMEEMLEVAKLDAFESAIDGIYTEASSCSPEGLLRGVTGMARR